MLHLVYVSSAVKLMSEQELLDILSVSRRNNAPLGITGMLLYSGGNFMQALEGPDDAVTATYEKILKDPRHKDIIRLLRKEDDERYFPDWSMGFRNVDRLEAKEIEGYSPFLKTSFTDKTFVENPSVAQQLLLDFKEGNR